MMMFFENLSIRYKILIPVTVLGCLMIILGIFSLNIMKPMTMIIHDDEDKAQIIRNSLKETMKKTL